MKKLLLLLIIQLGYISSIKAQEKVTNSYASKIISQETIEITDAPAIKENLEGRSASAIQAKGGTSITGSTYGELSVSLTGAATYNIPIDVPPGLNGVQPEISLTYNSQGGNGLAGWGWNISGVSIITRIPSTQYHDNKIDGVDFDSNDRFSFDGQRLILKSGTYGADGAVYQTENYSNVKITSHGTHPTSNVKGPKYFTVRYPDGSFAHYGLNNDSRSSVDYAITHWENPQGVRISYEYTRGGNGLLISKIKYGSRGTSAAVNEIQFVYKNRTRPEQAYIGGTSFVRKSILSSIGVKGSGGVAYRNYTLKHNASSLGYDRLYEVKESVGDNSKSRKPITFNYDSIKNGSLLETVAENPALDVENLKYDNSTVVSGDYTGNGKMDFIIYPNKGKDTKKEFWLYTNIQSKTKNRADVYNIGEFETIEPIKYVNQSGYAREGQGVVAIQHTSKSNTRFRLYYHASVASGRYLGNTYTKDWDYPSYRKKYISGDFDGDGLTDIIAMTSGIPPIEEGPCISGDDCWYTGGTDPAVFFITLDHKKTSNFAKNIGQIDHQDIRNDKYYTADVNGDGKTDILQFKQKKVFAYHFNTSTNKIELLWSQNISNFDINRPLYPGDYNGDGKTDFLYPHKEESNKFTMLLSSGNRFIVKDHSMPFTYKKFFKKLQYNFLDSTRDIHNVNSYLIPTDINGDGKTDIIAYDSGINIFTREGTQKINIYQNTYSSDSDASPRFSSAGSISKNGKVYEHPVPIFINNDKPNYNLDFGVITGDRIYSYQYNKDHNREMKLKSIANNGMTSEISYGQLSEKDIEGGSSHYRTVVGEKYPYININLAPNLKIVKKLKQTGAGKTRTKEFYYEGAVSHAKGLGFLGFKRVTRSNWQGNNVETLWNISDHDPMLRGAVVEEWVATSSSPGDNLSHTIYDYDYKLIANPSSPSKPGYKSNISVKQPITGPRTDEASNSVTLLPGFYANGNKGTYIAKIVPPEDQPGASGYAGVSDLTLKKTTSKNVLTGVTTTETYIYDEYKNITKQHTTFPGGSKTTTYQYSNNLSANNTSYHVGRVTNKTEQTVLGGSAMTSEEVYTYQENLVKTSKKKGNGTDWLSETFAYDENGNLTSKQLSGKGVIRTEKFEYATTYGKRFLTKSTDVEGLSTTYTYDAATGNPLTTTNPYGLKTTYTYDSWNRLKTEKNYLNKTTEHVYSPQSDGGMKITTNYPEGAKEEVKYNAFGWKTRSGTLSLNGKWIYTSYEYDILGRNTKVSEPYTGGASQWNETKFDKYGRVIDQTLFTGKHIRITYNGLSSTVNDGIKTVTTTVDALGNKVKVTDPGGTVNYIYYPNGVMKTANYDGHEVSVQIDGWGRKIKLTDPAAGTYTYKYDILGQLLKETTPKGATEYTYNGIGKMLTKKLTGDHTNISLTYQYDGATKLISSITGVNNTDTETYNYTYSYDSYKRPSAVKEVNNKASFEKRMNYDGYGRVNTETYSSKNLRDATSSTIVTKNVYDSSSGLLEEIRDNTTAAVLWKVNDINARGQALKITLGNGMTQTTSYDAYGYVSTVRDVKKVSSGNNVTALSLNYNFNAQRATLTNRKNNNFNWNENFGYDNLDRLNTISGNVSKTMTFDTRGRIAKNTDIGDYAYEANNVYRLKEITPNVKGENYYKPEFDLRKALF